MGVIERVGRVFEDSEFKFVVFDPARIPFGAFSQAILFVDVPIGPGEEDHGGNRDCPVLETGSIKEEGRPDPVQATFGPGLEAQGWPSVTGQDEEFPDRPCAVGEASEGHAVGVYEGQRARVVEDGEHVGGARASRKRFKIAHGFFRQISRGEAVHGDDRSPKAGVEIRPIRFVTKGGPAATVEKENRREASGTRWLIDAQVGLEQRFEFGE